MSSTTGGAPGIGAAKASGLLPSIGIAPRVGTISTVRAEEVISATTPRAAASRA